MITVEYAGPASYQVGPLPCYDVRAWWTVIDGREVGRVKRAAGAELKRNLRADSIPADHVECVSMDLSTYSHPHLNAMLTFRVRTHEQFAAREELRKAVYTHCDGCRQTAPSKIVRNLVSGTEQALCYGCWHPHRSAYQVLHYIKATGRVQI